MSNAAYWADRFTALDDLTFKQSEKYARNLQKQFDMASKSISRDIGYWYGRLAENNDISYAAAKKLLKDDELSEFHMTVEEYIKHGKEDGLDPEWIKKLENASAKVHISRLEQIQTDMQQTIEGLYNQYETGAEALLESVTTTSYYHTAYEIAKGTGVGVNLHRLDKDTVAGFLSRPWCQDGRVFSDRIWTRKDELIDTLNTVLAQNLMTGADPQKAIDQIAKQFDVDKRAAGRLVMTETAAISSEARQKCMKDLDVEEFEVVATLDSRTSPICRAMDGQHFPMSQYKVGLNAPPFHCNCRTTTAPWFDDEFTQDETRAAREPGDTGYKTTTTKSYRSWAKEIQKNYGDLYKVPGDWEYKDWYDAVVKNNCKGMVKMDLQFFAEGSEDIAVVDFIYPKGAISTECVDVTDDMLRKADIKNSEIANTYTIRHNGKTYDVDGVNVVFEPKPNEKRVASVIANKLGGKVELLPRINNPKKIKTADYLWNGNPLDLKTAKDDTSDNYILNLFKKAEGQTNQLIVDITNSLHTPEQLYEQAIEAFKSKSQGYIERIFFVNGDDVTRIYERK